MAAASSNPLPIGVIQNFGWLAGSHYKTDGVYRKHSNRRFLIISDSLARHYQNADYDVCALPGGRVGEVLATL